LSEAPEKVRENNDRIPNGTDRAARPLGSQIARSWHALLWEQLWPPAAAALAVIGFFLTASWAGLWISVPP